KRIPAAVADALRVLEIDPGNDALRGKAARWLFMTGRYEDAERECLTIERRQPQNLGIRQVRAEILLRKGERERATAMLDQLLREDPDASSVLLLRAVVYAEADPPDKGIPLLRKVLALKRGNEQAARYHLALALARTGKDQEAQAVLAEMEARQALDLWAERDGEPNPGLMIRAAEGLLRVGK